MKSITLFALLMLAPFLCLAENFCPGCGRPFVSAKDSDTCGLCTLEKVLDRLDVFSKHSDRKSAAEAERRVRELGETARWSFLCTDDRLPIVLVDGFGEHRLDCRMTFDVRHTPDRIRIVLKDAAETIIIQPDGRLVKYRGVYTLDNVPLCLPGRPEMSLCVRRIAIDTVAFGIMAAEPDGRNPLRAAGFIRAGGRVDCSSFR